MYLQSLSVSNVRGFRTGSKPSTLSFERPDGSYAGWTVLAGRNGSGKTTYLRCIALALSGPTVARSLVPSFAGWVSSKEKEAVVRAAFSVGAADGWAAGGQPPKQQPWAGLKWTILPDGPEPTLVEDLPKNAPKMTPRRGPWYENPLGWFLAGYGPFRRLSGAASDAQRLMLGQKRVAGLVTLFDESASLAESLWWLQDLYPRSLENDPTATQLMESVIALLNDGLLPDGFTVDRYDSAGLWVTRSGTSLVLEEMSDGYRTVTALILDIVRRISAFYGSFDLRANEDGTPFCPAEGVILIDEIDVHLHVSWQQRIGFWLREHFPNIQFIVSTHSPFICQAASPGGLIRLPAPDDEDRTPQRIAEPLYNVIVNGGADRAVLSELFGLDSPWSEQTLQSRARLRALELRALDESADEGELAEIDALRTELGITPSDDVAYELAKLEKS